MRDESVITWQVVDALWEIEHGGTYDMCDRERVTATMRNLGYCQASEWLAANRHLYFQMLARARELNRRVAVVTQSFATTARERALADLVR